MKKKILAITAAAAISMSAVPAMAFENQFSGMLNVGGYATNYNNIGSVHNGKDAPSMNNIDQRARLKYIAKVSDDLQMVSWFEINSQWGNAAQGGTLDTDGTASIRVKNVYLDFNIPKIPVNTKVGLFHWTDDYKMAFADADVAGLQLTTKIDKFTGYFLYSRLYDLGVAGTPTNGVPNVTSVTPSTSLSGRDTLDLVAVNGKYAIDKNLTVGANYYALVGGGALRDRLINTIGANVSAKIGPADLYGYFGYQFGDIGPGLANVANGKSVNLSAFAVGATGTITAGPGKVNLGVLYLSGDDKGINRTDGTSGAWQMVSPGTSYYNDANMWIIIRNKISLVSSRSFDNNDLTNGQRGLFAVYGGYNGEYNKIIYGANIGYAQTAATHSGENSSIGTEINGTIGYRIYDNLTAKINLAYAVLGDAGKDLVGSNGAWTTGAKNTFSNDDPWLANLMVEYSF